MPPNPQIHQSQHFPPPPVPMAPNQLGQMSQSTYQQDNGMNEPHQFPGRMPGGMGQSQSFGPHLATTVPSSESYRMYEFTRHKVGGRKLGWDVVKRKRIHQTNSELKARIKNPAKDGRGRSSKVEKDDPWFSISKQRQSRQLQADLQRDDQKFSWQVELVQADGSGISAETGKMVCSKMIVILSRQPSQGLYLRPGAAWPLDKAIVDLGDSTQSNHHPAHHPAGGQQQGPQVFQPEYRAAPLQYPEQSPRQNPHDRQQPHQAPRQSFQEEHGQQAPRHNLQEQQGHQAPFRGPQPGQGPQRRDGADARITPMNNRQDKHSHHQSDEDSEHSQGPQRRDGSHTRIRSMHNRQDKHSHHQSDEDSEHNPTTRGKSNRDGKSGNSSPVIKHSSPIIQHSKPKVYDEDSDSSSDRHSVFDDQTDQSSDTEVSIESSSSKNERNFSSRKGSKSKYLSRSDSRANSGRHHDSHVEYVLPSHKGHGKRDSVIEPALSSSSSKSGRGRGSSSYTRDPSVSRHRPSLDRKDSFNDRVGDENDLASASSSASSTSSRPHQRESFHKRRLATHMDTREEVLLEREENLRLQFKNLNLERELEDRNFEDRELKAALLREERIKKKRLREERITQDQLRRAWEREQPRRGASLRSAR